VFPRELVITPDEVKGTETTLERAVTTRGWPTLGASRGRVMFFMDDDADFRRVYTRGNANLDGRMLFVDSVPGEPFAAVRIMNNPVAQMADITAAVRAGYLVRTFGDESAEKVMMNNRDYVNAALASGAHIISTDHPALTAGLDFVVEIPGGTPSRCNPVNAPSGCTSTAIENPARLSP
jgi:hypothetical protein